MLTCEYVQCVDGFVLYCIIFLLCSQVVFFFFYFVVVFCCQVLVGFDDHGFCMVWGKSFESQWLYMYVLLCLK